MIGDLIGAAASIFGGLQGQKSQEKMAQQNIQLQKDFAQQGIQWKVEDAKKAGIHPLYALGANTHSFAPVSIGDSLSSSIANAGQYLGRAANATATSGQRVSAATAAIEALSVERAGLENELLRSQIRRNNSAGTPPAHPGVNPQTLIPGQGNAPLPGVEIDFNPHKVTGVNPATGWGEVGTIPAQGWQKNPYGYFPVPSADVKQRIEDITPAEWQWALSTYIGSATNPAKWAPPGHHLRPGEMWRFSPFWGHYIGQDPRYRYGGASKFSPGRRLKFEGD